ncbi:50S ribosomal protein L29 [Coxiella endosymbiont of Ornithodoros amblus]|uniref:50S ribosomal protein L29 n=1 Tax=Coxiella endosymbiont of Ornithodoros amblus TaxID=1656166 RepID=UPI00244E051E|nr:50S ribosomal protein L29 [Coxiella endosymbiont of Ornithodoros amblus]MBW5802543.1 50S ribosomal protein L29 [Coxiella endosymbiont of Ornithodoros amblus]
MNVNDFRNKTKVELKKELFELLKEQFNLRMQKGGGEAPRPHLFKRVRRDIARVKTLLGEKECNNE